MKSTQNWEVDFEELTKYGDTTNTTVERSKLKSFIHSVEEKAREDERQKLALQIAEETMDLCENSQEFKHRLLQSLNK